MRKIIYLMHMSLDGFVADSNGGINWIVYNDEVEKNSHDLTSTLDTAIYGRVTYQMMAYFWPTVPGNPESSQAEVAYANWLNNATKIAVSRTLDEVNWQNTVIVKQNVGEEINRLKQQPGKDMIMIGSPNLAQTFIQHDLIDEYRINVNPVVLGSGTPLFGNSTVKLNLLEAKTLKGGVIACRYEPVRA